MAPLNPLAFPEVTLFAVKRKPLSGNNYEDYRTYTVHGAYLRRAIELIDRC
jgi:hypothetical protein